MLYAFTATTDCTTAAVDKACASLFSDQVKAGAVESLTLNPTQPTDYIVVVDSWSPSEVGRYTLRIE